MRHCCAYFQFYAKNMYAKFELFMTSHDDIPCYYFRTTDFPYVVFHLLM